MGFTHIITYGRVSGTEKISDIVQYNVATVINKLKQYTMKEGRYLLIHKDKKVKRFAYISNALRYARMYCSDLFEFCVIVDTKKDEVICEWNYFVESL